MSVRKVLFTALASIMVLGLCAKNAHAVNACTTVEQHRAPVTGYTTARIERKHRLPKNPGEKFLQTLNKDSETLVEIARSLYDFRIESLENYHRLDRLTNAKKPLSTRDMELLLELEKKRQSYTRTLTAFINKYRCELFQYDLRAFEKAKGFWAYRMATLLLSAHILMSDNLISYALIIQHNPNLRHALNAGARVYGLSRQSLENEMSQHFAIIHRDDLEWTMDVFKLMQKVLPENNTQVSFSLETFFTMNRLVLNSVTYNDRLEKNYFDRIIDDIISPIGDRFRNGHLIEDSFLRGAYGIVSALSKAFGFTIAQIQFKDGLMYKRPDLEKEIIEELEPGDILWDKTRYKVSGMLIPGHWNHNAVWIGSKEDLQKLGIWNHPLIVPHQAKIEKGQSVIEALRFGVVLNTMEHFMNIDDFAAARPKENHDDAAKRQAILNAFRHMGTPYAFNFDIGQVNNIICSQLVMLAYPEINWKQEKLLGNWSTTPDLLAVETLEEGPLEITLLYQNANRLTENLSTKMNELLDSAK